MTQSQFQETIARYINEVKIVQDYCHLNLGDTYQITEDIDQYYSLLSEIRSDDLISNIPEAYYDHIISLFHIFDKSSHPFSKVFFDQVTKHSKAIDHYTDLLSSIENTTNVYHFYKQLRFALENVVIVGANGSGKTSLANSIKKVFKHDSGIVIPAQKSLILPTLNFTPSLSSIELDFKTSQKSIYDTKTTYQLQDNSGIPYDIASQAFSQMKNLILMLIAERESANAKCGDLIRQKQVVSYNDALSTIDAVIDIWNDLIEHRELVCNTRNELIVKFSGGEYPAYMMSDGEKVILFHVAEVLLAPKGSFIIVDEPEMYLHKSILDKLWNKLETERKDCVFFYFTHDIQFASSRNARKCWIKSFIPPSAWDINYIENDTIPDEVLLLLLGSRKKVLFCEGTIDSIDYKVYCCVFSNFTVSPVGSCNNVIAYTKAFNQIPERIADAYGIIDRDFRSSEELESLKDENVYSLNYAEIENVLLDESLLELMSKKLLSEDNIVPKIKSAISDKFINDKEYMATRYVERRIVYSLERISGLKGRTIDEVNNNYSKAISSISTHDWYIDRVSEIEVIHNKGDYREILQNYNNKGLFAIAEHFLNIRDYQKRVLRYLANNVVPHSIISTFPKELVENH